jgi:hypothetical protein
MTGRCTYGPFIDRELFDLTHRDAPEGCTKEAWLEAAHLPLDDDKGRAFLYARYDADLSREGLNTLGFPKTKPEDVQKLDSVEHMDELLEVGRAAGKHVKLDHFGSFA